jgi:hypothetical protein
MYFYPCEDFTQINLKLFQDKAKKQKRKRAREMVKLGIEVPKDFMEEKEGDAVPSVFNVEGGKVEWFNDH